MHYIQQSGTHYDDEPYIKSFFPKPTNTTKKQEEIIMKIKCLNPLLVLVTAFSLLFCTETISEILVGVQNQAEIDILYSRNYDVVGFNGEIARLFVDQNELTQLQNEGYTILIIHEDALALWNSRTPVNRSDFAGSVGNRFFSYQEVSDLLDEWYTDFPNIISDKFVIGTTEESREIWAVRICANPDQGKPEVFYNSLTHAREPAGMMTVMYFMDYLLNNYDSDPNVTYLVNNRELWFVPIVNPDGYEYNYDADGNIVNAGLWRKNRQPNVDPNDLGEDYSDCPGVDPNRNFSWEWQYESGLTAGSDEPCSDGFRGFNPMSTNETDAISYICTNHNFKLALNYHTYSDLLIRPWDFNAQPTSDENIFDEYTRLMASSNAYIFGQAENILYACNGTANDYMYHDFGILSFTPEVGNAWDNFWPDADRLELLMEENIDMNMLAAYYGGAYLVPVNKQYIDVGFNDNGSPDRLETVELVLTLRNYGLASSVTGIQGQITTIDPYINITYGEDELISFGDITESFSGTCDNLTDPFEFNVLEDAPVGHKVEFELTITGNDYSRVSILEVILGTPYLQLSDDAEDPTALETIWDTDGVWGIQSADLNWNSNVYNDYPDQGYPCSTIPPYPPQEENNLTLITPLDLSDCESHYLLFNTRYSIEEFSLGQIEISSDNNNWISLKGIWNQETMPEAFYQDSGLPSVHLPGENGYWHGWQIVDYHYLNEIYDLSEYNNYSEIYIRFQVNTYGVGIDLDFDGICPQTGM